jgi:16S rRNA (uracil1498-N3)-methyltransferase
MTQTHRTIRLYVPEPFAAGQQVALGQTQSHYLANVMRCREGELITLFNGQDGQWRAQVDMLGKKSVSLTLQERTAAHTPSPDLWLAFAPVKNKVDVIVEKAVELGVSALLPVYTRHAIVKSINHEKLLAHAIEAAEQCERHDVPRIEEHKDLAALLGTWPKDRTLLFADENGSGVALKNLLPTLPKGKYGILVGPEGGFAAEEQHLLTLADFVKAFGMGPRILRADTAAIAALACVQAWLGDWEQPPHFMAS